MALVVSLKWRGQTGDGTSAEIIYLVEGTGVDAGNVSDEDAYDAVAASAPSTWRGIFGANIEVREELAPGTIWSVAAIYGGAAGDSIAFEQSTVDYEFSFQAPQEKIYQSIATYGAFSANGAISTNMFGGAINVTNDNGEQKVDGLDLPGGTPNAVWVYKPLNATVSNAYQSNVEQIMGDVNSFSFKGRPAGTMRFVSCDGGAVIQGAIPKWTIRYGFQLSRNRSNFSVGGIQIPFKAGHHLLWCYYEDGFNDIGVDDDKGPIKRPKFAFVEQVFFESNFSILGLGF